MQIHASYMRSDVSSEIASEKNEDTSIWSQDPNETASKKPGALLGKR